MTAVKYIVDVVTDIPHNWHMKIKEIFVPELKACFNEKGYCFHSDAPRDSDFTVFNLSAEQAEIIKAYLDNKEAIKSVIKEHFGECSFDS